METEASQSNWLTLTDYSSKYRVSISTLRRRIKGNQIAHQFHAGKYLLQDVAPSADADHDYAMAEENESAMSADLADLHEPAAHSLSEKLHAAAANEQGMGAYSDTQPILSTATKLLNELKKAYMSNLAEKEEQMILLKEEVTDLKTLVRVLEQENDRLRVQQHARMNQ